MHCYPHVPHFTALLRTLLKHFRISFCELDLAEYFADTMHPIAPLLRRGASSIFHGWAENTEHRATLASCAMTSLALMDM
jgi:hypothetical protein